MVQTVNIRRGEKRIMVHFSYNNDLIDIMREHKGWWFRKEKGWQFPLWKLEQITDDLKSKKYNINITKLEEKKPTEQKQMVIDYWKLPDVVSVPGICKSCKQYHLLGKSGLCSECSLKP